LVSLPRDIQAEAIPLILGGGDVLAVSTQFCGSEEKSKKHHQIAANGDIYEL